MSDYLDNLLTLPTVLRAKLSPDRKWIAFVWYHQHENRDVFLVPADGSASPLALTHTNEATMLIDWTADSKAVLVEEDIDRDERVTVYRVDIDNPLKMIPLTDPHPPFYLRCGSISPDGQTLYYSANFDFQEEEEIEQSYVYAHNIRTGSRAAIAKPAKADWILPMVNNAGTHLIYTSKELNPSGRQVHLIDLQNGSDREILNFGAEYKVYARWLKDNRRMVFTTHSVDGTPQEHISLGIYDIDLHDIQWLMDDPDRNIESAFVAEDGMIIVDEIIEANHHCFSIDPGTLEHAPAPAVEGNLIPLGMAADGSFIGLYYAADSPTDIVRYSEGVRSAADFQSLTDFWQNTDLQQKDLFQAESITWKSEDGETIQGWLYRAAPNQEKAVLYIHGGPSAHSENKMNPQIQYYLHRGFNVLDVNYRGSTGFGLRFRELIKEDGWGGREQTDISCGAKKLIELGLAEPGAVGVTGTSYGGYSAWCQITQTHPDTIGASAPICGMTDLVVDYITTRPDLRQLSEEMIGGTPDEIPEKYLQRSPINFVQNIRGALLIIQGGKDPNVSPENVREVRQKLDQHGIPYEIKVFDDEGHGINRPANQKVMYQLISDFFEKAFE